MRARIIGRPTVSYRCSCCKVKLQSFFRETAVCYTWRCGIILCLEMVWHFLQGTSRKKIYRLWGANLPGDQGSPVTIRTIGNYLHDLRTKVAQVGFRDMMTYRLGGHVQLDETFVRTKRKFNTGRVTRGRKFTLVKFHFNKKSISIPTKIQEYSLSFL